MRICGLSRATEKDIHRCYDAVRHAPLHRSHTFLATSDIHLEHKLKMTRDECIEKSAQAVACVSAHALLCWHRHRPLLTRLRAQVRRNPR